MQSRVPQSKPKGERTVRRQVAYGCVGQRILGVFAISFRERKIAALAGQITST